MPKTILIADDDMTVTKLFNLDAESVDKDIVIHSAGTGQEAITLIEKHKPDVLVLDLRMPQGDGFTVLEHMEKMKMATPVVVLTNYNNQEYREKTKTYAQVKDYMVKHEVRMERVINKVAEYLG
jgi:two-component system, NarL family, response regulator YdfI